MGTNELLTELRRLLEASKVGDFSVFLNADNLFCEDSEIAGLLNEVVGNYRIAVESELMKYGKSKNKNEIEKHTYLLQTVNHVASILLQSYSGVFEDDLHHSMGIIANAVSADRMYIWKNHLRDGQLYCTQIHEWSEGADPQQDNELAVGSLYSEIVPGWEELLSEGRSINGIVREMSEHEKAALSPQGILSILIEPIFIKNQFWGFAGFDDCHSERVFSKMDVMLLHSANQLITNALLRNEIERETVKTNELNHALINTAPVGFEIHDGNFKIIDCNNALLEIFGVTKEHYFGNFFDFFPEHQPDGSKSLDRANELFKKTLKGENLKFEWTYRLPDGKLLPCEITTTRIKQDEKYFVLAYIYDLRNIKKVEKEKAEAMELTKLMFDSAPIGLTLYDENFNFIDCNDAVLKMYGVTKQFYRDYFGNNSPEYQPDGSNSKKKALEFVKQVINKGENLTIEWLHCAPDGTLLPVELTLTRIKQNNKYIGLGYMYDLRSIKKLEEKAQAVYFDALTGIYNRRYFDENLKRLLKSLSRSHGVLSLMMIDIDYFKQFNDAFGHGEGDKCLRIIAESISKCITRTDDFVARYGGEEFVVVLPSTDEKGACKIAEELLENIRKCNIPHRNSMIADHVTISIGVTTGNVEHMQSPEDYINQADISLYDSKRNGRDRYTFLRMKDSD